MYTYLLTKGGDCLVAQKRYCEILSEAIAESGKSKIAFYTELGIKKAYFYDIIKGKVNPPPREKQLEIIRILSPNINICIKLFETAAEERGEISADLFLFIDNEKKNKLRKQEEYIQFIEKIKEGDIKNV